MIVVNTDYFFLSHRLPIALAASRAGADVMVVATDTGRGAEIASYGLRYVDARMSRMGRNPIRELQTLSRLWWLIQRFRPDVLHLVAVKAVVYGGFAVFASPVPAVVSAVTGAGYALSPDRDPWLRKTVNWLLKLALTKSDAVVFQHETDQQAYVAAGLVRRQRTHLVRGVGVDPDDWREQPEPDEPIVLMAARLIQEKGVREFVDAARAVRKGRPSARFVLVGRLEPEVPTGISREQLDAWVAEGVVEWWGYRTDMREVLGTCQVFVLPTFHNEGVPKVLLEAGAVARAVVASDIAGCRAVIRDCVTGVLVPPRRADKLADAIDSLLADATVRRRLARALRQDVLQRFRESELTSQSLDVYALALAQGRPRRAHAPSKNRRRRHV